MANGATFFDLPREIRDIIYDLAFADLDIPKHSNIHAERAVYTSTSAPLLYVHTQITEELQCLIYKEHKIVIPIQELSQYIKGEKTIDTNTDHVSHQRRLGTKCIAVELIQTQDVYETDTSADEKPSSPIVDEGFWDDKGKECAKMITEALLNLKSSFPNVESVDIVLWDMDKAYFRVRDWKGPITALQSGWEGLRVFIDLYVFQYYDENAGDGGYNYIQGWDRQYKKQKDVHFTATNLEWEEPTKNDEQYHGQVMNPAAWELLEDEDPPSDSDFEGKLYLYSTTVRPMYITCLTN
ncbi:hypothetical protein SLS60_008895 [Paraconiothyrium brasiliense]|uniref:Uncharacterized protein n=1 Tax=Paraconiothyrium brasiliense TaxID=300254 RepID=A0ABR3QYT1_9PLEO